jgi:hypothetical protein
MKGIFATSVLALAVTVATPPPSAHAHVPLIAGRVALALARGALSARMSVPFSVPKAKRAQTRNSTANRTKADFDFQLASICHNESVNQSSVQKDSEGSRTTSVQISAPKDTIVAVTVSPSAAQNQAPSPMNGRVPAARSASSSSQRLVCRHRG